MMTRLVRGELPVHDVGIVHIGPGAFFRAFNAIYTHEAMSVAGGAWGICAVSLKSPTARDQLDPQGNVFTSVTLDPAGETTTTIASISQVLVAPEDPARVLSRMADPLVKVVSLTITEKGYCHEPSSGDLNFDDPDVTHDLASPSLPRTAVGFVVRALQLRKAAGLRPFTVLSCDNLPNNGSLVRGVVLDFAKRVDEELVGWIEEECCFPATMVDRITPATTAQDIDRLASKTGVLDEACVFHEPFRQWVIEDSFVDNARPDWETAGAQFVGSVEAHELMKLRCLNGTHSTLSYLGYLAGYETIAKCVSDPAFSTLCQKLWTQEITPSVPPPQGEDLDAYCQALLSRYQNPAIKHRTWQIAMDGSQKLPQRILGTISDNLAAGRPIAGLSLAVAGWMRYVGGVDEAGRDIDVRDPLARELRHASDQAQSSEEKVHALLSFSEIFNEALVANQTFKDEVTAAYLDLVNTDAKAAVEIYVN